MEEQRLRPGLYLVGKKCQCFHHVIDPVDAEGDAHAGYIRNAEKTREIVIASPAPDAADLHPDGPHLEYDAGIIIQPSREGQIDRQGLPALSGSIFRSPGLL